jgi:ankyrin repeat protein
VLAAENGHHQCVSLLIANGANASIANKVIKVSPAAALCSRESSFYGMHASVEQAGETALVKAAGNGHPKCVSILIDHCSAQVIYWS